MIGGAYSKILNKNTMLGLEPVKIKAAHPVNYFPWFLGKRLKIMYCPPNYSALPPCIIKYDDVNLVFIEIPMVEVLFSELIIYENCYLRYWYTNVYQ